MFRPALRSSPRLLALSGRTIPVSTARRFASTAPAQKKGTWRGAVLRWGLAAGLVYWYATGQMFAGDAEDHSVPVPASFSDADKPTIDRIVEEKRKLAEERALARAKEAEEEAARKAKEPAAATSKQPDDGAGASSDPAGPTGGVAALEEEAEQQGAFNPETGEINWDCPCLGGMAHGPCGEEFRAAFSCFVYSTDEPKGMDCIEKFQHMQDCFRKYPEIYGAELTDEEDIGEGEAAPAPGEGEGAEAPMAKSGEQKSSEPAPVTKTSGLPDPKSGGKKGSDAPKSKDPAPDSGKTDASEPVALSNKGKGTVIPDKASP